MSFNIDTNEFDFKKVSNLKPENINGNYYSKMITKDNISVKFSNKFTLHSKKLVKELIDKILKKNDEFKLVKESDKFIISKDFITLKIDTENKKFYKFCAELDDFNVKTAFFNSESWFGNKITYDVIDNLYKQIIRLDKNICPYLKVFLTHKTLNPEILEDIYDNHDNKDSEYIFNLEYYGLKFFKQQFTGIWLVTDIIKKEIITDEQAVLFFNQDNEVELNLHERENIIKEQKLQVEESEIVLEQEVVDESEIIKEQEVVDKSKAGKEHEVVEESKTVKEQEVVNESDVSQESVEDKEQEVINESEITQESVKDKEQEVIDKLTVTQESEIDKEQELNYSNKNIQLKVENKKIQDNKLKINKKKKLKKKLITKNKVKYLN
jgi:hypothetical protein